MDNIQVFKDRADKRLETLLKASFALAGFAIQPAVATFGICQSLKDRIKRLVRKDPSYVEADTGEGLAELPLALCFAIHALKDSIQQISSFALVSAHMWRVLWLKTLSAELP